MTGPSGAERASGMFFIQFGAEHVPKSLSLRGGPEDLYWEPFIGVVVITDIGPILLDTGMSRATFESPEVAAVYGTGDPAHQSGPGSLIPLPASARDWAWISEDDPLETALATIGLRVSDLALAAITHLHFDHSGGIPTLSRHGVPIVVQRRELAFVRSGAVGVSDGFFAGDWADPDIEWIEIDGDQSIAPGVSAVFTPGHTPGHMSFLVSLDESGDWLFAGDAADLAQNFLDDVPCGSYAGGSPADEHDADVSFRRLVDLARSRPARIVPGHDQLVFAAVTHPRGGHR